MTNGDKIRSMNDKELAKFLLRDDNLDEQVEIESYEDCFTIVTEKGFDLPYKEQTKNSYNTVLKWLKKESILP